MALSRLAALLVIISLGGIPARGQKASESDRNPESIRKILGHMVVTKQFAEEMPLAKFLEFLEKQLPKKMKMTVRLDGEAFGDKLAEVAATPILLPPFPKKLSLGGILQLTIAKMKNKADYRIGTAEIVITTPQRALYTAVYDIGDIVAKPVITSSFYVRNVDPVEPSQRTALVVQALFSTLDPLEAKLTATDPESIQVLNGNRLVIRANASRHAQIAGLLQYFRRMGGLAMFVKANLYEVDEAFYKKLKNLKPINWEEEERLFLGGKGKPSPWDEVYNLLKKQKRILTGEEIKVDDGQMATLLSRHRARSCLAGPEQLRKGEKGRQSFLIGVSFLARLQVSPDRRFVRFKLTEKATELQGIKKLTVWGIFGDPEKDVVAEVPLLKEYTLAQMVEAPDGGSILVPVQARPAAKDRWWVLSITPRIWIKEEEEMIRKMGMEEVLPLLVADVLKNPRLKTTREFYGSPADKRFALVDSPAWTWPENFADISGFRQTPAKRAGKRLLGIRVDPIQEKDNPDLVTLTLVNAGGSANGAVIGGGTIRYTARNGEKGWLVELVEE